MAIPDYQSIMLPLLKLISDTMEHPIQDVIRDLGNSFKLSEKELKELLPSGQQEIFANRAGWARTYLKKAGLLNSPRRGVVVITERGTGILKTNPKEINIALLKQFPEFVDFQKIKKEAKYTDSVNLSVQQTPGESLEYGYQKLMMSLAQDLLDKIKSCSPSFFERLVVELLVKMGYGGSRKDAGQAIGKSGDEGIDGIIKEDRLGLDVIYIQAKKWEGSIGRPEIMKFVGALQGQHARKGVLLQLLTLVMKPFNMPKKLIARLF